MDFFLIQTFLPFLLINLVNAASQNKRLKKFVERFHQNSKTATQPTTNSNKPASSGNNQPLSSGSNTTSQPKGSSGTNKISQPKESSETNISSGQNVAKGSSGSNSSNGAKASSGLHVTSGSSGSNTTKGKDQPKQNEESSIGLSGFQIFLILVVIIIIAAIIFYAYSKYQEYMMRTEGAMKTEKGIKQQNLNSKQKHQLQELTFNDQVNKQTGSLHAQDVIVKPRQEIANDIVLGQFLQADFNQEKSFRIIIGNQPISKKETSYFEIEIQDFEDEKCEIGIGYCSINVFKDCNQNNIEQKLNVDYSKLSVQFKSDGKVIFQGKPKFECLFNALQYGETMGIGCNIKENRIWITHNGEFLNPPPMEEIKAALIKQGKIKKEVEGEEKDKEANLNSSVKQNTIEEQEYQVDQKEDQTRKQRIIKTGFIENEDVYPFVIANDKCKIDINVGGHPFKFNQKEIATGLLN